MRKITDPCYTSNDCESHYNIDPILIKPSKDYGFNSDYCSGVLESCDPNTFNCREGIFDPALNTANVPMGCTFGTEGCKEFQRTADTVAKCDCWEYGKYFVDDKCKTLESAELCGLADYFCKWDGTNCTAKEYFTPPNVSQIKIDGTPNCPNGDPTCRKFSGRAVVNCSRSNTNPTISDSLNPKAWMCKIEWEYPGKSSEELTIRNPMCQYVPDSTMCTFRTEGTRNEFMCSRIIAAQINQSGQIDSKYLLNGFCTWCQGQSNTPGELGYVPTRKEFRFPTEWEYGKNRCGQYNMCEVQDSEILYNKCAWDESVGKYGVDPKSLEGISEAERKNLLLTKGFCYNKQSSTTPSSVDPIIQKVLLNCNKLLEPTISANNTSIPNSLNRSIPKGTPMGNWTNECNNGLSNNYYCTWCPSLQDNNKHIISYVSYSIAIGIVFSSIIANLFL